MVKNVYDISYSNWHFTRPIRMMSVARSHHSSLFASHLFKLSDCTTNRYSRTGQFSFLEALEFQYIDPNTLLHYDILTSEFLGYHGKQWRLETGIETVVEARFFPYSSLFYDFLLQCASWSSVRPGHGMVSHSRLMSMHRLSKYLPVQHWIKYLSYTCSWSLKKYI